MRGVYARGFFKGLLKGLLLHWRSTRPTNPLRDPICDLCAKVVVRGCDKGLRNGFGGYLSKTRNEWVIEK